MSAWWAIFILAAAITAKAETAIVVRAHTEITQNRAIILQDVAEFFGVKSEVARMIGAIKLAESLAPGEHIEFSGSTVSALLRRHAAWANGIRPTFTIPSRIEVENVGNKPTEAQLRMDLVSRWQGQCACRIELSEMSLPKIEPWAAGTEWSLQFPAQPARGSFTMAMQIKNSNSGMRTLWLRGRATHYKMSPVTRRQIAFGERVQPEDYQMTERDVTFARDAVPEAQDLTGRKARQNIAVNEILFTGMLEREKALKRGDQVKIAMGEGDWEVVLMGIAEQDGFVGDTVKIRNSKSQQLVVATVVGRGEVKAE